VKQVSTLDESLESMTTNLSLLHRTDAAPIEEDGLGRTNLFDLAHLQVEWEQPTGTLWTWMTPEGRPNFSVAMLKDFQQWQSEIRRVFGSSAHGLKYLVLGSRFPGVFNLGGDLDLFAERILSGDRDALVAYGRTCVSILYQNMRALDLPLVTIGLVEGDALGGGFEALMSFNVIVAERGARFGLPESMFGLFPGMGAHSFLSRRLGAAQAERMILSGETYSAEQMHDLGLVHVLAEPGQGRAAVEAYIGKNGRRQGGHLGVFRASRRVNPITLEELENIVDVWADSAMSLRESDLKLMRRLVDAQRKLVSTRLAD
jgi:DSF synthase